MSPTRAIQVEKGLQVVIVATCAVAIAMVAFYAPIDSAMGVVQKLIYLHLPAAIASFVTAMGVFIGGLGYLWTRKDVWNRLAHASGRATVACSLVVLITGIVWARVMWGVWWTWSPRLSFTLVMCLLYLAYLLLKRKAGSASTWETPSAIYGCIAFLEVPLLYLAIRLLPDVHPTSLPLTGEMRQTLVPCFLLVGLVCVRAMWSSLTAVGQPPRLPPNMGGNGRLKPST